MHLRSVKFVGTELQRQRLEEAYNKMDQMPGDKWLIGNWMQLRMKTYDAENPVLVNTVLNPECGFCTAGMLAKVGLEQIGAPPPARVRFETFLKKHYGLTEENIEFITGWNDDAWDAEIEDGTCRTGDEIEEDQDSREPKTGGLRAIAVLLKKEKPAETVYDEKYDIVTAW